MSLYRCAACGSPHVVPDMQSGGVGFNYLKGTVGTLILGVGGTVAGVESKSEQVFKCPDCGLTLSYPMEPIIKTMIDLGVESLEARDHLTFGNGVSISWDWLTKQYKNIEKGPADAELANAQTRSKAKTLSLAAATKEEFDAAVDVIGDIYRRIRYFGTIYDPREEDHFAFDNPMTLDEYLSWKAAVKTIVENISKYLSPEMIDGIKYRGVLDKSVLNDLLCVYLMDDSFPYRQRDFEDRLKWELEKGPNGDLVRSISLTYDCWLYRKRYDGFFKKWMDDINLPSCFSTKPLLLCYAGIADDFLGFPIRGIGFQLPRVIIRNGLLGFGIHSFPRWRSDGIQDSIVEFDMKELIEDYLSQFPGKKESVLAEIEEYKKKCAYYEQLKAENERRLTERKELQSEIEANSKAIETLEKKIFGKAKAREEISFLQAKSLSASEAIEKISGQIAAFDAVERPKDREDFVNDIFLENGCFIAWRWVYRQDEPKAELRESETEAETSAEKAGGKSEAERAADIPSQIKQYAELLSMGAITQEEYNAKKKQLLGL